LIIPSIKVIGRLKVLTYKVWNIPIYLRDLYGIIKVVIYLYIGFNYDLGLEGNLIVISIIIIEDRLEGNLIVLSIIIIEDLRIYLST